MEANQPTGFCQTFSNLLSRNLVYTSTLSSLVFGFQHLSSLPQALFRSPLLSFSEVAFSTIFNEMPSVDITRSLYPFFLAILTASLSFLSFMVFASSFYNISSLSFSSHGVLVPSIISSYHLLSAMTLNFKANLCQLSLVLLNLYTLILFRLLFSSLIL